MQDLEIGQEIQIKVEYIGDFEDKRLEEVGYYNNVIIDDLPSWIQFKKSEKTAKLQILKQSLGSNILVFKTF